MVRATTIGKSSANAFAADVVFRADYDLGKLPLSRKGNSRLLPGSAEVAQITMTGMTTWSTRSSQMMRTVMGVRPCFRFFADIRQAKGTLSERMQAVLPQKRRARTERKKDRQCEWTCPCTFPTISKYWQRTGKEIAMTVARSKLVDVEISPWYHVISKTLRGAFLLAEGDSDRKQWIEDRLREPHEREPLPISAYTVMPNHLFVVRPETNTRFPDSFAGCER